jgi:hypothetical protein
VIRDIHVLLLYAGNVEFGSDLLCENASSKFELDERVDRRDPHPSAVRGIPEFHTTHRGGRVISPSHGWGV